MPVATMWTASHAAIHPASDEYHAGIPLQEPASTVVLESPSSLSRIVVDDQTPPGAVESVVAVAIPSEVVQPTVPDSNFFPLPDPTEHSTKTRDPRRRPRDCGVERTAPGKKSAAPYSTGRKRPSSSTVDTADYHLSSPVYPLLREQTMQPSRSRFTPYSSPLDRLSRRPRRHAVSPGLEPLDLGALHTLRTSPAYPSGSDNSILEISFDHLQLSSHDLPEVVANEVDQVYSQTAEPLVAPAAYEVPSNPLEILAPEYDELEHDELENDVVPPDESTEDAEEPPADPDERSYTYEEIFGCDGDSDDEDSSAAEVSTDLAPEVVVPRVVSETEVDSFLNSIFADLQHGTKQGDAHGAQDSVPHSSGGASEGDSSIDSLFSSLIEQFNTVSV